ncbi:MAG: IPExxxVDY family protein [Bacteroidota bacterium]|nr:IPExxxVDY family protein [Bacteroidota bacterium]
MAAPRKYKLDDFEVTPFTTLAVTSSEKDYKLCHRLNKALKINFKREGKLFFHSAGIKRIEISCFRYADEEMRTTLHLSRNRQESFFLLPKFKNADFIICVHEEGTTSLIEELKSSLAHLPNIQSTFVLPKEITKNISFE